MLDRHRGGVNENAMTITTTSAAGHDPAVTPPTRRVPRMATVIGLFYAVTLLGAGGLGLVQPLLRVDPVILELAQFGPLLGVLAVLLVWRRGWRPPLAAGLALSRPVLARLLAIVVISAGIFAAAVGAYALLGVDVEYISPGALPHSLWLIAAAQLLGACAEESGWRCFLQPYLRTRYGILTSGMIVGLLWGLWHAQVFAYGPAYGGAFLISTIAISVVLAVVLEGDRGHTLLVAGSFHALINLGLLLAMPEERGDLRAETILSAACLLAALVVIGVAVASGRSRARRRRRV
jgi:membrane protease YdiL (CAAX protease family)